VSAECGHISLSFVNFNTLLFALNYVLLKYGKFKGVNRSDFCCDSLKLRSTVRFFNSNFQHFLKYFAILEAEERTPQCYIYFHYTHVWNGFETLTTYASVSQLVEPRLNLDDQLCLATPGARNEERP
jgi:hypothetical protein